jgi:hypothetical protein
VSRSALLLAVVTLGGMREPCGTETTLVGLNAPCQRSTDCDKGLSCVGGMCALPDGGPKGDDGPAADARSPDAADDRAGD